MMFPPEGVRHLTNQVVLIDGLAAVPHSELWYSCQSCFDAAIFCKVCADVGRFTSRFHLVDELPKDRLSVADDTQLGLEDLAQLVRIDVDLNHMSGLVIFQAPVVI